MESWEGTKNAIFESVTMRFFLSTKEVFNVTKRVALSKHVTHYGSWTGFSFYILTAPNAEGLLYLP